MYYNTLKHPFCKYSILGTYYIIGTKTIDIDEYNHIFYDYNESINLIWLLFVLLVFE